MAIPSSSILRGAIRWLTLLPNDDVDRVRAMLGNSRLYSDLTPTQHESALGWLIANQMASKTGEILTAGMPVADSVFRAAVTGALWFQDADILVDSGEDLPDDAIRAAQELGLSPDSAFQQIRFAWGLVDARRREEIGAAGELAVMEHLSRIQGVEAKQLSNISDGFGYDIVATYQQRNFHIEVKTTTRLQRASVYVSRNEFEVSQRDPNWFLILVRLDRLLNLRSISTVDHTWFENASPVDRGRSIVWQSIRVELEDARVVGGIADLPC